jgi:hypothetical protein
MEMEDDESKNYGTQAHNGRLSVTQAAQAMRKSSRLDPDWYNRLLNTKDCCDRCGETYRLENVRICTNCSMTFIPATIPKWHTVRMAIGNAQTAVAVKSWDKTSDKRR